MLSEQTVDRILYNSGYERVEKLRYRSILSNDQVEHFCEIRYSNKACGVLGNCGCGNVEIGKRSVEIWNQYSGEKLYYNKYRNVVGASFNVLDEDREYSVGGVVDMRDSGKLEELFRMVVIPLFSPITTLQALYSITVDARNTNIGLFGQSLYPIGVRAIQALLLAKCLDLTFESVSKDIVPAQERIRNHFRIRENADNFLKGIWDVI